jgi:transposase
MTVPITRSDHTAEQPLAAAARCKDAAAARRMLAIAHVLDGVPLGEAAALCGMDRQTLRDWVHRYNADGLSGLVNHPLGGGPTCMLTKVQEAELAGWVEAGPDPKEDGVVRWRRQDLRQRVADRFGVHFHEGSIGKVLRRPGFSHVSVRPRHPKAGVEARQAHKKTSANSLRMQSPTPPAASRWRSGGRTKPGSVSRAR